MAFAEETPGLRPRGSQQSVALAREWRKLGRAATFVALLTSPALFLIFYHSNGWGLIASLLVTAVAVIAFRGLIDVLAHKVIPSFSIYGAEKELQEDDIVQRRRLWYWRKKWRRAVWLVATLAVFVLGIELVLSWTGQAAGLGDVFGLLGQLGAAFGPTFLALVLQLPLFFLINFLILFGPLVFLGIQQIKGYEPGDADWGVKLDDVRGQAEAKEEITRVVALWQSGEEFEKAGGKRERGVLFNGPPGTGKTMLSKGIATSFNCPFVSIPGSGFAQTFIGMDAVIVRFLARKAKKLAAKWGGQCIVFIDEIDAVGMRRQALGPGVGGGFGGAATPTAYGPQSIHDYLFYGAQGALTPDGDLILESRAWRERVFAQRAEPHVGSPFPAAVQKLGGAIQGFMFPGGMGMGGGLALNQLLVVMDGIDDPPWTKRMLTSRINTFLDSIYVVPRRLGKKSLRLSPPKPRKEEIYFIGACNVPIDMLDPALTRPGRMGRHVWFRTPTKHDRKDIFDLYINKVDHEPDLDTDRRREEVARITHGYSPAMIEQVCSMALTYAHSEGRPVFGWGDLVEAMTTVESGTAVGIEYVPEETRAVAIHEAGHAAASHVYSEDVMSTRLSLRMRGASLGHHAAIEKEERFSKWRSEQEANLIWTLGAMAAEQVFYRQTSSGVGGDLASATQLAALMVGMWGMGPVEPDLEGRFDDDEVARKERDGLMERFERLGLRLMNRARGGTMMQPDPISSVLGDPSKRTTVAQLLGQAYVTAYNLVRNNRDGVQRIADTLVERREMHGDEVVSLLDSVGLSKPQIDLLDPATWPKL
jgi:cell division protease FtsH